LRARCEPVIVSERPDPARPVVALVEDEPDLAATSRAFLERDGFRVLPALDARSALTLLDRERVELLVLDLGLPDHNGLDLLRSLRHDRKSTLPVIIVSGRGEEADRVVGLELGADDYLVKPFSQRELAARIRAVLRRLRPAAETAVIRIGELEIDTGAREIRVSRQPLALTPLEYALVEFLASAPGRTYSREQLLTEVWDSPAWGQEHATVAEHVYRIRRKLAAAGVVKPRITTVRGFGYRLDP
jgi:two-component system response regulator ResD